MNLKLSYRDKVIFIVVICILVLVVGFLSFVNPKIDEMGAARIEQDNQRAELERIKARAGMLEGLIEEMKETAEEIDLVQQNFYVEADPYIMEQIVRDLLGARQIEITEILTEYALAEELPLYRVFPENVVAYPMKINADLYHELPPEVYAEYDGIDFRIIPPGVMIGITTMKFDFEAATGIDELLRCLDDLADEDNEELKTLVVVTFASESGIDDEEPTAENSIMIRIFSIVPMDVERLMLERADADFLEMVDLNRNNNNTNEDTPAPPPEEE